LDSHIKEKNNALLQASEKDWEKEIARQIKICNKVKELNLADYAMFYEHYELAIKELIDDEDVRKETEWVSIENDAQKAEAEADEFLEQPIAFVVSYYTSNDLLYSYFVKNIYDGDVPDFLQLPMDELQKENGYECSGSVKRIS
jgi:predicted ATPase